MRFAYCALRAVTQKITSGRLPNKRNSPIMVNQERRFSPIARTPRDGLGQLKEPFHDEKTASPAGRCGLCRGHSRPISRFRHSRRGACAGIASCAPPPPPSRAPPGARRGRRRGRRRVRAGENAPNYAGVGGRFPAAVAPADFVEEIWVRNVADLAWESIRLRRLKSQLLHATAHQGVDRVL